jgi:uncharacterized protein YdhG (YjbR/CyaY superfamily)
MSNEVDEWFAERQHPFDGRNAVCPSVDLGGRPAGESIKWKTPTFAYQGNIVSFNPSKNFVS